METILVIDDHDSVTNLLKFVLSLNGFEVATASSGREGAALIELKQPDLVISDLKMPDMNGVDLVRQEHAGRLDVKWILMSGDSSIGGISLVEIARELPISEILPKPFTNSVLMAAVRRALGTTEVGT